MWYSLSVAEHPPLLKEIISTFMVPLSSPETLPATWKVNVLSQSMLLWSLAAEGS